MIDLTQTLDARVPADRAAARDGPVLALPHRGGLEVRRARPGWYWNNFSCGEHTGTHFDAPIHWISGRDLPNNSVDTIPVQHFVAPACVIDCSTAASRTIPTTCSRPADIEALRGEARPHPGRRLGADAHRLVQARTTPRPTRTCDETGQHTPGPSTEAVRFLVEQRDVLGFGSEAIGTDAGQGYHLRPPYPCHYYMHGAGRYGLQCLSNLDLAAARGRRC